MKNEDAPKTPRKVEDTKGLKPEIVKSIADKKKALENGKIIRK
jgi:hypothetical protein